jgi:dolichyl-phosphate beta-glucosyltransferase
LPKTLDKVVGYLKLQSYDKEVLVINDGSVDKTAEVVNNFSSKFSFVKQVVNEKNQGKAYSVNRGVLTATGDLVLFMDADGSTSIEELDKLLSEINNGYDVAIGSRRVFGANVKQDQVWSRLLLGWVFRQIVSLLLPINIIDTQNGFKLFKKEVAKVNSVLS